MATVTSETTTETVTVEHRTVTVVLSEAEAQAVGDRLQQSPAVQGDDGGEIGLQIQQTLA